MIYSEQCIWNVKVFVAFAGMLDPQSIWLYVF